MICVFLIHSHSADRILGRLFNDFCGLFLPKHGTINPNRLESSSMYHSQGTHPGRYTPDRTGVPSDSRAAVTGIFSASPPICLISSPATFFLRFHNQGRRHIDSIVSLEKAFGQSLESCLALPRAKVVGNACIGGFGLRLGLVNVHPTGWVFLQDYPSG